jgi:hypothetical protein
MSAFSAEAVQKEFPWAFTILLLIWLVPAIVCFTVPDWWFAAFWIFPASISWLLVPVFASVLAAVRFWQARYWMAGRLLLLPILCVVVFWYGYAWGDRVWFELHRPTYEKAVAEFTSGSCQSVDWVHFQPKIGQLDCGPPIVAVFEFGSFLSMWHGVVYDQSDELAKETGKRSAGWTNRPAASWLSCSDVYQNLDGHY